MRLRKILWTVILSFAAQLPLAAQTISGSISGTVVDVTGAVVPQATVTAKNMEQNTSVSTTTDSTGNFVFPQLLPATYNLTVEKAGFKTFEQRNVILNAFTNLAVGNITLQVGAVAQMVEVTAQGMQLQTENAARMNTIVGTQLQNIEVNGRSPLSLLRLVPGVVFGLDTTAATNRLVGYGGDININGARANSLNATINGVSVAGGGENGKLFATLSLDSVQEFSVLTSNYQAQYGRAAGGTIMYVTKSGGKDLHGSGYWYYRDKGLNAASWSNNRDNTPKSQYHYNYLGYTVGGPAYIPGKFNTNKNKLFFFFSEEYQRQLAPEGERRITVPTALERQGDFSQSVDRSGNTVKYIRDPNSGQPCHGPTTNPPAPADTSGCFQDGGVLGKIPAASQYAPGIALLNIFPMPNVSNPSAFSGRNYRSQVSSGIPRHERLIRLDSNLRPSWRLSGSLAWLVQDFEGGAYGPQGYNLTPNYPIGKTQTGVVAYSHPSYSLSLNLTTTINPTSTNEFTYGQSHHHVTVLPNNLDDVTRAGTGLTGANAWPTAFTPYADWIPQFSLSGSKINSGPSMRTGGGAFNPFDSVHTNFEIADNYTKVWNKHVIKAGIYMQRARKDQSVFAQTGGFYELGDSQTNPYDTGLGFANAAAGVYTNFTQANNFLMGRYRYTNLEWYLQDTWKVAPRVTFDLGLRAYLLQPTYDQGLHTSSFSPSAYTSSNALRLFWPCSISGATWACDYPNLAPGQTPQTPGANLSGVMVYKPGTGTAGESALGIQKFVPGVGSLTNGILPAGIGINKYLMQFPSIRWAPRIGMVIDLTGRGNLVFRAGAGAFYDRYQINEVLNTISNPPSVFSPTLYNGCLLAVGSSSPCGPLNLGGGLLSPTGLTVISPDGQIPVNYNFSAGIQARLPRATVLDVAYVGLLGRELIVNTNINAVPYAATFQAANQDPTKYSGGVVPAGPYDGSKAFDSNFLRPYRGYDSINVQGFGSTSNYNSLQVSVDRRFAKGLFFGVAYTWSKCLDIGSADGGGGRIDDLRRLANYGPCNFDVRQNLTFNYVYSLPGVTGHGSWDNKVTRAILNGWQVSGITVFRNVGPFTPGYTNSGSAYTGARLTGTGDAGATVKLVGNPLQGTSDDPYNRLNVNAFAPPTSPSLGLGSPRNYITPPGINNWDMSLQKNVRMTERAHLEFRIDAFNAFNHTQFSGLNASPTFNCAVANCANGVYTVTNLPYDANGNLVNKSGFGTVGGARSSRVLQTVIRLVF